MTRTPASAGARAVVRPEGTPDGLPWSPAVRAGGWVFVSGQTATDLADRENPFAESGVEREARDLLPRIGATLAAAGCDLGRDVVRIYQWMPSPRPTYEEFLAGSSTTDVRMDPYNRVMAEVIDEPRPASTAIGVRHVVPPAAHVGVDLIAMEPRPGLKRQGFDAPPDVPQPVVRYSPALRSGDWVFLAGFIATDFRGDVGARHHLGEPSALAPEARVNPYYWYGSSIELQTDYTLAKLERIAEAAGTSFERCIKAEVYIGHPQDLDGIERAWRRWFPERPPARVLVPYAGLAGHACRIEIALMLLAGDSELEIETVETSAAPEPAFHEPQAVRAGNLLFLSTQLPVDSKGALAAATRRHQEFPWYGQPARAQLRYVLENAAAICEAAGTSLANVCRCQAFHDDLIHSAQTIEEWRAHFPADPPSLTPIELGGPLLAPGAHLLLDLIGYVPDREESR